MSKCPDGSNMDVAEANFDAYVLYCSGNQKLDYIALTWYLLGIGLNWNAAFMVNE